jgi:hypothetical protein
MTTLRPFDTSTHSPLRRSIKRDWKAGEKTVKPGEFRPTETVVRFEVRHSKESKAFVANLTPIEVGDNFDQWNSDNPGVRTLTERAARYSEKALIEFSKKAYENLVENADHPHVAAVLSQVPGITVDA